MSSKAPLFRLGAAYALAVLCAYLEPAGAQAPSAGAQTPPADAQSPSAAPAAPATPATPGQTQKGFSLPNLQSLQNLPSLANAGGQLDALKQKAAETAISTLLDNQLPLKLDAKTIYPTVSTPPGGAFNPKPLSLSLADMDKPLPPGDYTLQALAFCTEYSVHQPGAGTAYVLAPLQGKAAPAISALLWRGTNQLHIPPQTLQGTSWAIQSGLRYSQMPKPYQQVIDNVIPEYKGELSGNFLQDLQDTYQAAAKAAHLPPLEKILGGLGQSGALALAAMHQQQILLSQNTSEQLREQTLFRGQESGIYQPVKAEEGPWTERIAGVAYLRYKIVGGNVASNNIVEIRILPAGQVPRSVQRDGDRLTRVAYLQPVLMPVPPQPTPNGLLGNSIGQSEGRGAQSLVPVALTANPCNLSPADLKTYQDTYDTMLANGQCACPSSRMNLCNGTPNQLWKNLNAANKAQSLKLPEATIYTDYCLGAIGDGIMIVPKACPDGSPMRERQFVRRTCPGGNCDVTVAQTTCGPRTLGSWYVDECNKLGYYTPDTPTNPGHVISDEPTANAPNGAPYQMDFYDFLTCPGKNGTVRVMEAFQWSRTGAPQSGPDKVQWCTVPAKNCPAGQSCPPAVKATSGAYSDLKQVNPDPSMGGTDLQPILCQIANAGEFPNDPGLKAIHTYIGCSTP